MSFFSFVLIVVFLLLNCSVCCCSNTRDATEPVGRTSVFLTELWAEPLLLGSSLLLLLLVLLPGRREGLSFQGKIRSKRDILYRWLLG